MVHTRPRPHQRRVIPTGGDKGTCHLYHIPTTPAEIVKATIGSHEDNEEEARQAFNKRGHFLVDGQIVQGPPT